jgi:hypothetical protein
VDVLNRCKDAQTVRIRVSFRDTQEYELDHAFGRGVIPPDDRAPVTGTLLLHTELAHKMTRLNAQLQP